MGAVCGGFEWGKGGRGGLGEGCGWGFREVHGGMGRHTEGG